MSNAREIAERIAAVLFRDGCNNEAQRLVLEMADGRDGGGWGRGPAVDAIEEVLASAPVSSTPPTP